MSRQRRVALRIVRRLRWLVPAALGGMAVAALLLALPEDRWLAVRIAVLAGVVSAFLTSLLLTRYERAAERDFLSEQEKRRRQMREIDRSIVDLRNHLAAVEDRIDEAESQLGSGERSDAQRPAAAPESEGGRPLRSTRPEAEQLRADLARIESRQQELEAAHQTLREDFAHELSALAARQQRIVDRGRG